MMDTYMPEPADHEPSLQHHKAPAADARSTMSVQQRHHEVIVLLERRVSIREIAAITGYCARAVSYIAQRYRDAGLAALEDRRRARACEPRLLTQEQQQELARELSAPPPEGGAWTGPKVAEWIAAKTGRPVHRQRGWEYLRRLRDNVIGNL
jgi:transposase